MEILSGNEQMLFVYLKEHLVQAHLILLLFTSLYFAGSLVFSFFLFYKLCCQMVVSIFNNKVFFKLRDIHCILDMFCCYLVSKLCLTLL